MRMEPGVQTPEQTLTTGVGSCRDSAWLLVVALRHFGLAARFVSGYLVQLGEDEAGTQDATDLHAWAEAYLPGAGWIGLDPTSALLAGEGHIPLAATPSPLQAAPITGSTGPAQVHFEFATPCTGSPTSGAPISPTPRISATLCTGWGAEVDQRLTAAGLELTMGGEPTFVSGDEPIAPEWTVAADGGRKRELAGSTGGPIRRSVRRGWPDSAQPGPVVSRRTACRAGRSGWSGAGTASRCGGIRICWPIRSHESHRRQQAVRRTRGSVRLGGGETLGLPAEQLHPCYESERERSRWPGRCR